MTLRKLTIDNSVKYLSKDSNSQSESSPMDSKTKTASIPKKTKRKINKFFENITGEDFRTIK